MQIVDPNEVKKKPKRIKKREPLPTPREYSPRYSHLQKSLDGDKYYYPRTNNPGTTYVKHMTDAINFNKKRSNKDDPRAIIFSSGTDRYRTIFGAMKIDSVLELEGVPTLDYDDIKALKKQVQEQKTAATAANFVRRVKTTLSMVGHVTEGDPSKTPWNIFYRESKHVLEMDGHLIVLVPKGTE